MNFFEYSNTGIIKSRLISYSHLSSESAKNSFKKITTFLLLVGDSISSNDDATVRFVAFPLGEVSIITLGTFSFSGAAELNK